MSFLTSKYLLSLNISGMSFFLITSCMSRSPNTLNRKGDSSLSSVNLPIPESFRPFIGDDKVNGFNLLINASDCDPYVDGSNIENLGNPLNLGENKFANLKIKQGCQYTVILSLGKLNEAGNQLQKVYFTNDLPDKRTIISKRESKEPSIKVKVTLYLTEDGRSNLKYQDTIVIVPSRDPSFENSDQFNNSTNVDDFNWQNSIILSDIPSYPFSGNTYGSPYFEDIMSHTPERERFNTTGPSTVAHESLHGLSADRENTTFADDGFIYFQNGKGAFVLKPKDSLIDVQNHIGRSFLEISRINFDEYLVKQTTYWKNILYIFNEWSGYIATTRTAVEIKKAGKWESWNADPVVGLADLMYFGSASLITLKNTDPQYYTNNQQFKATYAMMMENSVRWLQEAKAETIWAQSKAWSKFNNLQTSNDAANVRNAIKEFMGPTWTRRVLNF